MLGTLAKWLRILGYDTAYDNRITDDEIVKRCLAEARIALTRDARLAQRRVLRGSLLIESTELGAQLRQVLDFVGYRVDPGRLLSRCVECNSPLVSVSPESVKALVPEYVFRTQPDFKQCATCRRVYWGGTHREHIQHKLRKLLDGK
ncbi:MAG: hypothetical protein EHM61_21535 [Acidobacteria bacterium]|nr:MAG: hypothetical protein EHM61_21535 [Acidobacteriota bacterium]